jgi:hypothetical protein
MDAPTQVTVKTSMSYALMLYAPVTATATLICRWGWGAAARRAGRQAGSVGGVKARHAGAGGGAARRAAHCLRDMSGAVHATERALHPGRGAQEMSGGDARACMRGCTCGAHRGAGRADAGGSPSVGDLKRRERVLLGGNDLVADNGCRQGRWNRWAGRWVGGAGVRGGISSLAGPASAAACTPPATLARLTDVQAACVDRGRQVHVDRSVVGDVGHHQRRRVGLVDAGVGAVRAVQALAAVGRGRPQQRPPAPFGGHANIILDGAGGCAARGEAAMGGRNTECAGMSAGVARRRLTAWDSSV